jgi:AcrR family transcriptional regulator
MKKLDARMRYTQMVLKQSLLTLLKKKPINKVTVKEVCELAEVNRATFYAHYTDCFDLKQSMENELLESFEKALHYVSSQDVTALIEAIYDTVERNQEACRVLVLGDTNSAVITRMIALARENSIRSWQKTLPTARTADLEMLYTHLSNGLMHVIVEGYDKYSRKDMIRFVSSIAKASLSLFR